MMMEPPQVLTDYEDSEVTPCIAAAYPEMSLDRVNLGVISGSPETSMHGSLYKHATI